MRTEEIINVINLICKPYNLYSELHCPETEKSVYMVRNSVFSNP